MSALNRLKIVRIVNRYNIGGPMWNVLHLTKGLEEDFDTLLLGGKPLSSEGSAQPIFDKNGVETKVINNLSRKVALWSDIKAFFSLYRIIKSENPPIVHTHASKAGALGRLAAICAGTRCIVHTYHGLVFKGYFNKYTTKIIVIIERLLARRTQAIIAISEQQKVEIVTEFNIAPAEKVHVIPLGFDLKKFEHSHDQRGVVRKRLDLKETEVAIAIVGRLTAIKNHTFFIDIAYHLFEQEGNKYRFFVVGDGELRSIIEGKINEYSSDFAAQFVFTSWIEAMESFYPAMDIVCLTSINEGTPVSLIEAQASGIPVISTAVGGTKNTLVHGETGFLSTPGDLEEFVGYIHQLSADKNLWQKMSQNGPTFAQQNFSSELLISTMRKFYQDLLNNHAD